MMIAAGIATCMVAAMFGLLVFQGLQVPRVDSADQVPSVADAIASEEEVSRAAKLPDLSPPEPSEAPVAETKQNGNQPSPNTADSKDSSASEPSVTERPANEVMTVEQVVAKTEASVAFIEGRTFSGSGFIVRDGVIATNRHVIEDELISGLKIHFPSATADLRGPYPAELIYVDPVKDLAFLKVATSIAPLVTPQAYPFRRGQEVIAIGSPGVSGVLTLQNAVSRGVVSTEVFIEGQQYCQLNISINGGNSGGPVLDMSGQVIGVITSKATREEAVAFCITVPDLNNSINLAEVLTDEQIENNRSVHRLGVLVRTISMLTRRYGEVMGVYLGSIEDALTNGRSALAGIEAVQQTIPKELAELNELSDWLVDSELTNEASSISTDDHLPARIREQFAALWVNYKEIKSNVENPRGTVETFRSKKLQLTDTHDRLMHSLNLHLGIKE